MKEINLLDFHECDTCKAKPGSPYLCNGCLQNRQAIFQRDKLNEDLLRKIEIISLVTES
jgi:hypothetical protein